MAPLLEQAGVFRFWLSLILQGQPGRWSASFASMYDRGQNILPASIDFGSLQDFRSLVMATKLWRSATRKPILLFLLFGWLLLRIETRALSSLLFHEPPRRPYDLRPEIADKR